MPDVSLLKFSTCRLLVSNTGTADVAVKIENLWDLPRGVHVAGWTASAGVFSDNVWVVTVPGTGAVAASSSQCARTNSDAITLAVDLVSDRHGIVQWIAKVDQHATAAIVSGSEGGFETIVF